VQNGQKNTGECFSTKLKRTFKNSGTFEEKKFHPKKSITLVLHQAIQLDYSFNHEPVFYVINSNLCKQFAVLINY